MTLSPEVNVSSNRSPQSSCTTCFRVSACRHSWLVGGFEGRRERNQAPAVQILALEGFDLLEGPDHDGPTYPFRSQFQFDEDYRWLFLGRDWRRLRRLFGSYRLPLYHAASDLTPDPWRM